MNTSAHYYTDQYGYRCEIDIICEDDTVVFNSTPHLSFDLKKHGIKIRRSKYDDYVLSYVLKDGQIFLRSLATHLSFFSKSSQVMGVTAKKHGDGKWSIFPFDDIPIDYSGALSIGKAFDYSYWKDDDRITPVEFSPKAYKQNGYIKLEKGKITEVELHSRNE